MGDGDDDDYTPTPTSVTPIPTRPSMPEFAFLSTGEKSELEEEDAKTDDAAKVKETNDAATVKETDDTGEKADASDAPDEPVIKDTEPDRTNPIEIEVDPGPVTDLPPSASCDDRASGSPFEPYKYSYDENSYDEIIRRQQSGAESSSAPFITVDITHHADGSSTEHAHYPSAWDAYGHYHDEQACAAEHDDEYDDEYCDYGDDDYEDQDY